MAKTTTRSKASRKGCWIPSKPASYALSWQVPSRKPHTQVVIGLYPAHELYSRILLALNEYPDACLQVRRHS